MLFLQLFTIFKYFLFLIFLSFQSLPSMDPDLTTPISTVIVWNTGHVS